MFESIDYPENKIKTVYICPPIPIRTYDWCAYPTDNEDMIAWGKTEREAVKTLIEMLIKNEENPL